MAGWTRRKGLRIAALGAAAIPLAWAANLTVTGTPLGTGSATNTPCDTDGVSLGYTYSGTAVAGVTVSGIAAACSGGEVRVHVLKNATGGTLAGSGVQPIDATSETVTLTGQPAQVDSMAVGVVLVGP